MRHGTVPAFAGINGRKAGPFGKRPQPVTTAIHHKSSLVQSRLRCIYFFFRVVRVQVGPNLFLLNFLLLALLSAASEGQRFHSRFHFRPQKAGSTALLSRSGVLSVVLFDHGNRCPAVIGKPFDVDTVCQPYRYERVAYRVGFRSIRRRTVEEERSCGVRNIGSLVLRFFGERGATRSLRRSARRRVNADASLSGPSTNLPALLWRRCRVRRAGHRQLVLVPSEVIGKGRRSADAA